ncbi:MAG: FAD-binding oxidoreductase [Actinomycetota bacterium]|nr:FAD-binding oxidoreductase [Actinomycetota bacterium]
MRTIVTIPNVNVIASDFLRAGNVVYAPVLDSATTEQVLDTLIDENATALVMSRRPEGALLERWSHHVAGPKFLAHVSGNRSHRRRPDTTEFRLAGTDLTSIGIALRECERWFTERAFTPNSRIPPDREPRDAVLIGAGIVNLITAVCLDDHGYTLTIVDRSPAPGDDDWRRYGCTHAGDDARMFTFTEMDNYNDKDFLHENRHRFDTTIDRRGWRVFDAHAAPPEEKEWIAEYQRVPSWLARTYNEDIFAFNAEAYDGWKYLRARHPRFFADVNLVDDILRVYSDPAHHQASAALHRNIGALTEELTAADLAHRFPSLARSVDNGTLCGGLIVHGFTLNIHKLCHNIMEHLTARGVTFHWNAPVHRVHRDEDGRIFGFACRIPFPETAHVIASPGAYGEELLEGSACEGKIHGVLGGWVRVNNDDLDLGTSLKVARKGHTTEDANVTVATDSDGQKVLIVGSGYGYLGSLTGAHHDQHLATLRNGIIDTVERLFPGRATLRASSDNTENYGFKVCVRPWTATSLGIYHTEPIHQGRVLIINGGHNTGGFAQAPAVANAVIASLSGTDHPMHRQYHPARFTDFVEDNRLTVPIATAQRGFVQSAP